MIWYDVFILDSFSLWSLVAMIKNGGTKLRVKSFMKNKVQYGCPSVLNEPKEYFDKCIMKYEKIIKKCLSCLL